jgi:hypothetical protein
MVQLFYLFSCRSLTGPAGRAGLFTNRWVLAGVTAQVAGQLALTYLPVMNRLFQTAAITGGSWLRILILALAASVIVAADKRLTGWSDAARSAGTFSAGASREWPGTGNGRESGKQGGRWMSVVNARAGRGARQRPGASPARGPDPHVAAGGRREGCDG